MKRFLIIFVTVVSTTTLAYSKTYPLNEFNDKCPILKTGHLLYIDDYFSLHCRGGCPPESIFDHEISSGRDTKIETIDEFEVLVASIRTKAEALAYVRFLTQGSGQHLKNNPCPFNIELNGELSKISLKLKPINIEDQGKQFLIERNLLLYPSKIGDPTKLIRTQEIVAKNGIYNFGIKKVLNEDNQLNQYLIYRR